ncbi:MAG: NAD-dependent malic enzyme, partial [bacterium]|nr:NAD-dependent malic enzyme [bacterium]
MAYKDIASPAFSITARISIRNFPGQLAKVVKLMGDEGVSLAEMTLLASDFHYKHREITMHCKNEAHAERIIKLLKERDDILFESYTDDVFEMHKGGKLSIEPKLYLKTRDQLSQAYTPGVARICTHIANNPDATFDYTMRGNTVAVITDGTAVLGLGDIGPRAGLPVMEGKAMLFKQFSGLNAVPICLDIRDTHKIIDTIAYLSPSFGGINLEDISAPRCFEIETELQKRLDIPVFHDDQHGTACVVLAGLLNALKVTGKKMSDLKIVISGVGAGGVAIAKTLNAAGAGNIVPCDSEGIVYRGRRSGMNSMKEEILQFANKDNEMGTPINALKGASVFIGVSRPGIIHREDLLGMAKDPIIFALANPVPEIMPDEAKGIARIIATGRSDFANQVNNVLCFPGIFKGALQCRATKITENMRLAAANAIAESIPENELNEENIIPDPFNMGVPKRVAEKVMEAAILDGVARITD